MNGKMQWLIDELSKIPHLEMSTETNNQFFNISLLLTEDILLSVNTTIEDESDLVGVNIFTPDDLIVSDIMSYKDLLKIMKDEK